MTTILCTLYNSLYLDNGLVLYDSLCKNAKDFKLYVLCMDDRCYDVLTSIHQKYHIPVRLKDLESEDKELLKAKFNRPTSEYCWTCSSAFIKYVLQHFEEQICTYVDADMYFYNDPQILIDEMLSIKKSVMVIPHRFPKATEYLAKTVGKYCVEFNTFLNTKESLNVLDFWQKRCIECCSNLGDGIHWGDQKYLEELVQKFDCVYVCQHNGAGIAPWNITLYYYNENELIYKPDNKSCSLIFYHFQSISYITKSIVDTNIDNKADKYFIENIYKPYLVALDIKKEEVSKKYGIYELIREHPYKHSKFWFVKKYSLGQYILFLNRKMQGRIILDIRHM